MVARMSLLLNTDPAITVVSVVPVVEEGLARDLVVATTDAVPEATVEAAAEVADEAEVGAKARAIVVIVVVVKVHVTTAIAAQARARVTTIVAPDHARV